MAKLQRLAVTPEQIDPPYVLLTSDQRHYLSHVLRLTVGDRFITMDGQHHWWLTQLDTNTARILEPIAASTELPLPITVLTALPKGNHFDDVVRQATELGVSTIVPMISDRTLLQPSAQKLERWRRIAQEAAEQSQRLVIPTLLDPLPFSAAIAHSITTSYRYFCITEHPAPHLLHCLQQSLQQVLISSDQSTLPSSLSRNLTVAIATGPEGGWSDAEIQQAIASGFQPVSLGARTLRAVTAPVVALALIAATLERDQLD